MRTAPARALPAVLAFLLLAAHFFRAGWPAMTVVALGAPVLLFLRRRWAVTAAAVLLGLGALEWVRTLAAIAIGRQAAGQPWLRMALILGAVALFTAVAALLLRPREEKRD